MDTTVRRRLAWLAAALLALDAVVLAGHVAQRLDLPGYGAWWWNAEQDRGLSEIVGSLQLLVAAALLVALARRIGRSPVLVALPLLLAAIVVDDLARIHENYGAWLADRLSFSSVFGEEAHSVGELLVFAAYGVPLALAVLLTWFRSSAAARRVALHVAAGLALLVLSAVVFDLLAGVLEALTGRGWVGGAVRMLENAGELVSSSLVLLVAVAHTWSHGDAAAQRRGGPGPVVR